MDTNFIKSEQSNITLLTGVVNSNILNSVSTVLKYGEDDWGYQRDLKPDHVKGIVNYIKKEKDNCLFTNSIILALDKNEFDSLGINIIADNIISLDLSNLKLRIVDGQHRLAAIKESSMDFDLNVVILVIPQEVRKMELDVFTTINSKAKRIPTDLAELAVFKYLLLNEKDNLDLTDSINYVSMKIIIGLNDSSKFWKDGIKVDINQKENHGIVGVSAFKKTIQDIVKDCISGNNLTIPYLDSSANEIQMLIDRVWEICYKKWKYCFEETLFDKISYSKNFYLQKTMGISVIHGLLKECKNNMPEFEKIIMESKVKTSDWESGNIMSGYSSESGFSKIRKFIKNEITL